MQIEFEQLGLIVFFNLIATILINFHLFIGMFSCVDQYENELVERKFAMKLIGMNALIMIELGELDKAQTVVNEAHEVHYIGPLLCHLNQMRMSNESKYA
ncbi:MAG: hypothetical protein AB8B80_03715 [Marinicellaceae bacterium]